MFAVLINHSRYPVRYAGIYSLSSALRNEGYSVKVLDFFYFNDLQRISLLLKYYITEETRIVGFSGTLANKSYRVNSGKANKDVVRTKLEDVSSRLIYLYDNFPVEEELVLAIFSMIRSINPRVQLVYGGSTLFFSEHYHVDWLIKGEGEGALVALANHLSTGKELEFEMKGDLKVIRGDNHPFDRFHTSFLNFEHTDFINIGEYLPLELARGCIFHCSYCTYTGARNRENRFKDPGMLREWLTENQNRYETGGYMITDEILNESVEKLKLFEPAFRSLKTKAELVAYGRLDQISRNPEMAEMMLEMGTRNIMFGIETLHDGAGRRIGKGLGKEKILKTLRHLRNVWGDQISIAVFMIAGLPKEPPEHFEESILMLFESGLVDNINIAVLDIFRPNEDQTGSVRPQTIFDDPVNGFSEYDENFLYGLLDKGYFHGDPGLLQYMLKHYRIWKHEHNNYFKSNSIMNRLDKQILVPENYYKMDHTYVISRNIGFSREQLRDKNTILTTPHEYEKRIQNYIQTYLDRLYYGIF